jgi:hypothetical protein
VNPGVVSVERALSGVANGYPASSSRRYHLICMAIFENPNSPEQPQPGVYIWYAHKDGGKRLTIYVGEPGKRKALFTTGTLCRGACQLQRTQFTSNGGLTLNTNFVVGTGYSIFRERRLLVRMEARRR